MNCSGPSCTDFAQRVNLLLDARRPLMQDQQLVEHAAGCTQCNADLRRHLAWQRRLADAPTVACDADNTHADPPAPESSTHSPSRGGYPVSPMPEPSPTTRAANRSATNSSADASRTPMPSSSTPHGLDDTRSFSSGELEKAIDVSDSVVAHWASQLPDPPTPVFRTLRLLSVACLCGLLPVLLVTVSFFASRPAAPADSPAKGADAPQSLLSGSDSETPSSVIGELGIDPVEQGIGMLIYRAEQSIGQLDNLRPTMHLLGISRMFDSLDLTLNLFKQLGGQTSDPAAGPTANSNATSPSAAVPPASDAAASQPRGNR